MTDLVVDRVSCLLCGSCVGTCPVEALVMHPTRVEWDGLRCTRCGLCVRVCPVGALSLEGGP